jgi:hypothetical protein
MNRPVFLISILAGLIIIVVAKSSLFIGVAIMLGGTIMSIVLSNVSNSVFGIDDDDDDLDDMYPKKDNTEN